MYVFDLKTIQTKEKTSETSLSHTPSKKVEKFDGNCMFSYIELSFCKTNIAKKLSVWYDVKLLYSVNFLLVEGRKAEFLYIGFIHKHRIYSLLQTHFHMKSTYTQRNDRFRAAMYSIRLSSINS